MKSRIIILSLLLSFSYIGRTQVLVSSDNWCKTAQLMNEMRNDPATAPILEYDDMIRAQEMANGQIAPKGVIYKIPIVFHILHNGGPENISEEQILNALHILNRDFRLQNPDTSEVLPTFKPIMGDVEVEFVLATKAPNGECFRGYTRTESPLAFQGDDGGMQVEAIRTGNDVYQGNWPAKDYLNIFVVASAGEGIGGYTNYPYGNGNDMTAGIWVLNQTLGQGGIDNSWTSLGDGRTLTHECGHWLNLPHTWGSTNSPALMSNCSSDDGVSDTPNTIGVTTCNIITLGENSCGPLANIQNYMDYSFCSRMFTQGQATRMRNALLSSVGGRNNLWSAQNLANTGTDVPPSLCSAEFTSDRTYVCPGTEITFIDQSYNAPSGWTWSFPGGTPSSSTLESPTVTYDTPGIYEVSLTATDGTLSDTEIKAGYIQVMGTSLDLPIYESFENYTSLNNIPEWAFKNEDNNAAFEIDNSIGLTGNKCVKLANYGQASGSFDELISGPVDLSVLDPLSDIMTLSFRYAYKRRNSSDDDRLQVFITNDCGESWALRKTLHGSILSPIVQSSSFSPSSANDWTTVHMPNVTSNYWADNFRYKFTFESGGGNNFYLDDINIYSGAASDDIVVGISDLEIMTGVSVYPNPAINELNVQINLNSKAAVNMFVQSVEGKIVQRTSLNGNKGSNMILFNTKEWAPGMYIMHVEVAGRRKFIRFVVS